MLSSKGHKAIWPFWCIIGLVGVVVGLAFAQSSPKGTETASAGSVKDSPATTVSVQVNVVNVLATVRDKHGKIVNDLVRDDFNLIEDGRSQTVHYFAKESDLPLTLGLLVDTSLSQRRVLDQERSASRSFLDKVVREEKDKAFVIHFDREVELLRDLTSSHDKLESAVDGLQTPPLSRDSTNGQPGADPQSRHGHGGGGHAHGGGTLLYDAVYLASDEVMKKQQGRKALIILSDGVDRGSKESLETAIETAQRSDNVVYSVLFKDDEPHEGGNRVGFGVPGMGGPGMGRRGGGGQRYPQQEPRPDGKKVLERISKETGGRLFEVSKKEPVDKIYAQIEEDLRSQYNLGYTPQKAEAGATSYHKIQLTTKKKGLVVQAREGYYADGKSPQ